LDGRDKMRVRIAVKAHFLLLHSDKVVANPSGKINGSNEQIVEIIVPEHIIGLVHNLKRSSKTLGLLIDFDQICIERDRLDKW
jgi:hypothetical protein